MHGKRGLARGDSVDNGLESPTTAMPSRFAVFSCRTSRCPSRISASRKAVISLGRWPVSDLGVEVALQIDRITLQWLGHQSLQRRPYRTTLRRCTRTKLTDPFDCPFRRIIRREAYPERHI